MMYLWPLRKPRWLRAAGASGEVRRSAEVHQATCHSLYRSHHAAPAFGVCAELSWDSHHAVSCCLFWSPAGVLWSLSLLRAIVVTPHNLCLSQFFKWEKVTAASLLQGLGRAEGDVVQEHRNSATLQHHSFPKKMRNKPSPAESLQIPALSTHIHAEI